mmetsp:Transcript_37423/g.120527  ORF Transcript_37423/g.120527 Transcript_37423/m.120527 type:complete len:202 (-) Transcript_37423:176-781(-)
MDKYSKFTTPAGCTASTARNVCFETSNSTQKKGRACSDVQPSFAAALRSQGICWTSQPSLYNSLCARFFSAEVLCRASSAPRTPSSAILATHSPCNSTGTAAVPAWQYASSPRGKPQWPQAAATPFPAEAGVTPLFFHQHSSQQSLPSSKTYREGRKQNVHGASSSGHTHLVPSSDISQSLGVSSPEVLCKCASLPQARAE